MARSYETIKAEIQTNIRTYPSLNAFLFPEEGGSQVSIFNVIIASVALAVMTFETLVDAAKDDLQEISDGIPAGNRKWVQNHIKAFQNGDVVTFVDSVPSYNPVDESHRIVTQCSVKQLTSGVLNIKVAKGVGTLSPLSAGELTALKNYYFGSSMTEGIGFAGIRTAFINLNADRIMVQASVYFYGQYVEATVKAAVIAAINAFLAGFSNEAFDGTLYMIRLVDAIQDVPGVSRVTLTQIKVRDAVTVFGSATILDIQGTYLTVAGYIISEDTALFTLNDTITMIPEV